MRLIISTHGVIENVNDEESSLEMSTLGSTSNSGYDIPNMNYGTSLTISMHSSPVESHHYLSQTSFASNIESANNTEMVSGVFF